MNWYHGIKLTLPLAIVSVCLLGYVLHHYCDIFCEIEATLLSVQWLLLACLAVWCGCFIFLTFSLNDLPLIGILVTAIAVYLIGYAASWRAADAIILLAGVTLGKGARFALEAEDRGQKAEVGSQKSDSGNVSELWPPVSGLRFFLVGLVGLLAFSSWWHLDMSNNYYRGPRWMGLWDNPNVYGMLMGAGLVLAIGLLTAKNAENAEKISNSLFRFFMRSLRSFAVINSIILVIAAGMMGIGLLFSYSRGAWVGTAVGLLYLAWSHGRLKWRFVLPGIVVVAAVVVFFWHSTPDNAPWYVRRADLSRPSAQHRVAAWRGAVQMMWDHPLGVGWNKAIGVYDKNYSPPEGGATAITMNSYLMLGTELGLPGLVCFVAYVGLSLKSGKRKAESRNDFGTRNSEIQNAETGGTHCPTLPQPSSILHSPSSNGLAVACRAGALVFVVAFWFDGGLFTLATASVFWVLLELGKTNAEGRMKNEETERQKSAIGNQQSKISPAGFTLVELLVVIAIIGILAGMLMPVLNKSKNRAMSLTDINNLKQIMLATHLYGSDNADSCPWPNWLLGDSATRQGWLYTLDTTAKGSAQFKEKTGLFWETLRTKKIYLCPMDNTNSSAFLQRSQQLSSYAMNGAVCGYARTNFPSAKLGSLRPDDVAFWETDEKQAKYFNDGANFPKEGVSARHLNGAINAGIGGAVSYIRIDAWYLAVADNNKNNLWCYPGSADGR